MGGAATLCVGNPAPKRAGEPAPALSLTMTLIPDRTSNLRLRTKLVLSFVVIIAALSCVTLLAVRHVAKKHLQQEIVAETQTSTLTFMAMIHEHQIALARKADLLATLADLTALDQGTFQQSTDNAFETDGSDLVVLADDNHQITTLHTTNPRLDVGNRSTVADRLAGKEKHVRLVVRRRLSLSGCRTARPSRTVREQRAIGHGRGRPRN